MLGNVKENMGEWVSWWGNVWLASEKKYFVIFNSFDVYDQNNY